MLSLEPACWVEIFQSRSIGKLELLLDVNSLSAISMNVFGHGISQLGAELPDFIILTARSRGVCGTALR
jgi:hypothetical protein